MAIASFSFANKSEKPASLETVVVVAAAAVVVFVAVGVGVAVAVAPMEVANGGALVGTALRAYPAGAFCGMRDDILVVLMMFGCSPFKIAPAPTSLAYLSLLPLLDRACRLGILKGRPSGPKPAFV